VTLAAVAYDVAGRAIDVGRQVFRADRYSFDSRHVNP
jgi:DNA-binding GntR family transcriptional regulator